MKNRTYALLTGLFIIALGAAIAGVAIWLGGEQSATKPYRIVSHQAVSGLTPGSDVLYFGVPAGKVSEIHLARNRARTVVIDIAVNRTVHITRGTYAKLQLQGVTGASQVELLDTGKRNQPLPTGSQHPMRIPLRPSLLNALTHSGKHMLAQLDGLSTKLNRLVNKKNTAHIEQLIAHAAAATGELTRLERHLDRTAVTLPQLSQRMQQTLAGIGGVAKHLNHAATSLDRLARHATKLTDTGQALGQAALSRSLPELNRTLRDLQQTSATIQTLSRNFNRDPQRVLFGPDPPSPGPGEQGYEGPRQ
jgi:phospholipid/cholesterol/gamma-HCH transport system substrate-binding protein